MAKEIIVNVDVNTQDAVKGVDSLDSSMGKLNETTGELNTELDETGKKGTKGLSSVAKGFKGVGLAIKAAGIGLVVTVFLALKDALSKNQKALDFVNTATTAVGIVFNDLVNFIGNNFQPAVDSLSNALGKVSQAFEDIPATLVKLKDAIVENVEMRFNAMIETLGFLGDAIKKVFSGDFSGAIDDATEAGKSYVDALTGVENTVDKVVDGVTELVDATIEYTTSVWENSEALIANQKNLELLELQQTRIREQSDRDAERQRQIRDDYTKGFEERIAANEELGRILEEQERLEKKTITDRIAALQSEQNQLGSNFERRKEIYALNTELIAVEAQQEGFRSEQLANRIAIEKERDDAEAERKAEQAAKDKAAEDLKIKNAQTTADALNKIDNARLDNASNSIKLIASFGEKNKALQAAALVAENATAIAKTVINTSAANIASTAKYALVPGGQALAALEITQQKISAGISIATSIAATAKGLAALKKSGNVGSKPSLGGGGGGGNSSASTSGLNEDTLFSSQNLEGGSTESVGSGAGKNQQPIQAVVLESDITNTQNKLNNFQQFSEIG